jgi:uncharacterized protein (TIGR03066 family)
MKLLSVVLAGCLVAGVSAARAEEKKGDGNAEKAVGTWEVTKGESLPPGSTLELTKDGKLKLVVKAATPVTVEGTYKVDGTKLMVTMKLPDGKDHSETMEIKKLTDTELVTFDMMKQTDTFKKKK